MSARFGERAQIWTGRLFVILLTLVAYLIALFLKERKVIFDVAIRFGFSGFAALAPIMVAALFWRRSTKWGALASALWVAVGMVGVWALQEYSQPLAPGPGQPPVPVFPQLDDLFLRTPAQVTMYGFIPVVFLCLGSAGWMIGVSLLTRAPSRATLAKFFPATRDAAEAIATAVAGRRARVAE